MCSSRLCPNWVTILFHDNVQLHIARMTLLGHMLLEWHCSATCCQEDTARPHIFRTTLLGHMLLEWHCSATCCQGWHCRSSLTWDMRLCSIYPILLISHLPITIFSSIWTFFTLKDILFQKRRRNCIKRFLSIKTFLGFYRKGINNLVNRW